MPMFLTLVVDGVIKTFEAESGKLVHTSHEHRGWITDFLYWYVECVAILQPSSLGQALCVFWVSCPRQTIIHM